MLQKSRWFKHISSLILLIQACNLFAALPDSVRRESIDPARIERTLVPQKTKILPSLPSIPDNEDLPQQPPSSKQGVEFVLNEVRLKGNTALSAQKLNTAYQSYLGKTVTLEQVREIRDRVTALYRSQGYLLTRAILPPQKIKNGRLRIDVVEGRISDAQVEGAHGPLAKLLHSLAEKAAASTQPFHVKQLERYALLANDIPGVEVKAVLRRTGEVGRAQLVFAVQKHNRLDAFFDNNNRLSRMLGSREVNAGFYINSISGGSQTGIHTVTSNEFDRLRSIVFKHQQWLNAEGLYLTAQADVTKSKPNLSVIGIDGIEVAGYSTGLTVGLHYPVLRSKSHNLTLSQKFRVLNTRTLANNELIFHDKIRSLRLGLQYDFHDSLGGNNLVSIEWSKGLDILANRKSGSDLLSRSTARSNYSKVDMQLARLQTVSKQWSFYSAMRAQYAFNELLSSEEVGFGGQSYGRGYDNGEITGDHAWLGRAELRYQIPSQQPRHLADLYWFFDAGVVWNINHNTQEHRQSATSTGMGFHYRFDEYLRTQVEISKPISRVVNTQGTKEPRVFLSMVLSV